MLKTPPFLSDLRPATQFCPAHCFIHLCRGVSGPQTARKHCSPTLTPTPKPAHLPCFSPAISTQSPKPGVRAAYSTPIPLAPAHPSQPPGSECLQVLGLKSTDFTPPSGCDFLSGSPSSNWLTTSCQLEKLERAHLQHLCPLCVSACRTHCWGLERKQLPSIPDCIYLVTGPLFMSGNHHTPHLPKASFSLQEHPTFF